MNAPTTFTVTITGTDWNDQPVVVTVSVKTQGDAEHAKHIVRTQEWPTRVRKVATFEAVVA